MKKGPFRIIAIILLAVTLITLSGVAATASTLLNHQTVNSCCDADAGGENTSGKIPCSTPDCPCFSCISFLLPLPVTVLLTSTMQIPLHLSPEQSHFRDYVPAIEYPPEAA